MEMGINSSFFVNGPKSDHKIRRKVRFSLKTDRFQVQEIRGQPV